MLRRDAKVREQGRRIVRDEIDARQLHAKLQCHAQRDLANGLILGKKALPSAVAPAVALVAGLFLNPGELALNQELAEVGFRAMQPRQGVQPVVLVSVFDQPSR